MHVLIAEDDRVTGEILARTLQRWNYSTTLVGDGAQAWDRLRVATDPTLAILDWMMPEMDGPDVCRRVRQELPLATDLDRSGRGMDDEPEQGAAERERDAGIRERPAGDLQRRGRR